MSASSKKKLRSEEASAKLTEKQIAEQKETRKLKLYTIGFAVVMAAIVVAAAAVGITRAIENSGVRQRKTVAVTVGSHAVSNAELSYYYIDEINNFYNSYGSYLSLYGLDTKKPLDQQVIDEDTGETWADSFMAAAKSSAQSTYAMVDAAAAAGYTLSEEDNAQVTALAENVGAYAAIYGYPNANGYLRAMYGAGATVESFQDYYRSNLIASGYRAAYETDLSYTADEIAAKDAENPLVYNSYAYNQYYISTSRLLTGGTTAEDGTTTYTEEEKAAAVAAAEEAAKSVTGEEIKSVADFDAAIAALSFNADTTASSSPFDNTRYESANSSIRQWLSDAGRKEGDTTYVASTGADDEITGYYAVYYRGTTDNKTSMVNVRHILVGFDAADDTGATDEEKAAAKAKAEDLLAQWKSGEATEDSFAILAHDNTTDTGSQENGGLYENVYPGQMVTAFNDWCFDAARKVGDTGIVETSYGYHVMFFSGVAEQNYRDYLVETDLKTAEMADWYQAQIDACPITDGNTSYLNTSLILSGN